MIVEIGARKIKAERGWIAETPAQRWHCPPSPLKHPRKPQVR